MRRNIPRQLRHGFTTQSTRLDCYPTLSSSLSSSTLTSSIIMIEYRWTSSTIQRTTGHQDPKKSTLFWFTDCNWLQLYNVHLHPHTLLKTLTIPPSGSVLSSVPSAPTPASFLDLLWQSRTLARSWRRCWLDYIWKQRSWLERKRNSFQSSGCCTQVHCALCIGGSSCTIGI